MLYGYNLPPRLNPLLELLRRDALQWLWSRPFMEDCFPRVDPRHCREWCEGLRGGGRGDGGCRGRGRQQ